MKRIALLLALMAPMVAFSKAAFNGKEAMIKNSGIIAVVEIESVDKVKEKRKGWTYSEAATAMVERTLKGELSGTVTLHGGEDFICAQVHYKPGRYIVFLRHDDDLLVGANWHLGVRPITGETVEWFKENTKLDLSVQPLTGVLKEIEEIVKGEQAVP